METVTSTTDAWTVLIGQRIHTCGCAIRNLLFGLSKKARAKAAKRVDVAVTEKCSICAQYGSIAAARSAWADEKTRRRQEAARRGGKSPGAQAAHFERQLRKMEIAYRRKDTDGKSIYFDIFDHDGCFVADVRFSDHAQPECGGYAGDLPGRGDVRHGASGISCDPVTGKNWRNAIEFVSAAIISAS